MNTALKILVVLSSGLAAFHILLFGHESYSTPLFLSLVVCLLGCLYVIHLWGWFTLPPVVRHVAYFSSVFMHAYGVLFGILTIGMFVLLGRGEFSLYLVAFTLNAFTAPAGLFAVLWLNGHLFLQSASLWRGALVALPLAAALVVPEYAWVKYHEQRLAAAQANEVVSSLHSLSSAPFGRARYGISACKSLLIRDISDPYFMYNDNDTTFREDRGVGIIETKLRERFGADSQKIIDETKVTFGSNIMLNCSQWTNPTSG